MSFNIALEISHDGALWLPWYNMEFSNRPERVGFVRRFLGHRTPVRGKFMMMLQANGTVERYLGPSGTEIG